MDPRKQHIRESSIIQVSQRKESELVGLSGCEGGVFLDAADLRGDHFVGCAGAAGDKEEADGCVEIVRFERQRLAKVGLGGLQAAGALLELGAAQSDVVGRRLGCFDGGGFFGGFDIFDGGGFFDSFEGGGFFDGVGFCNRLGDADGCGRHRGGGGHGGRAIGGELAVQGIDLLAENRGVHAPEGGQIGVERQSALEGVAGPAGGKGRFIGVLEVVAAGDDPGEGSVGRLGDETVDEILGQAILAELDVGKDERGTGDIIDAEGLDVVLVDAYEIEVVAAEIEDLLDVFELRDDVAALQEFAGSASKLFADLAVILGLVVGKFGTHVGDGAGFDLVSICGGEVENIPRIGQGAFAASEWKEEQTKAEGQQALLGLCVHEHQTWEKPAMSESKTTVYIGLGSNLGDRAGLIAEALRRLDALDGVEVGARSGLYETKAAFVEDQPDFLNACACLRTTLSPEPLMKHLLAVEHSLGRVRDVPKGPRTIDLDLLLYGDEVVDEEGLRVPHEDLQNRAFVLIPLAEIGAKAIHPVLGVSVGELLERLCEGDA